MGGGVFFAFIASKMRAVKKTYKEFHAALVVASALKNWKRAQLIVILRSHSFFPMECANDICKYISTFNFTLAKEIFKLVSNSSLSNLN